MKRSRWVAGLLSLMMCGLGHLYVGAWRRGVEFLFGYVCINLAALLVFVHVRSTPLNIIAGLGWIHRLDDRRRRALRA